MIELKLSEGEIREILNAIDENLMYISQSMVNYLGYRKKEASLLEVKECEERVGGIRLSSGELQQIIYCMVGNGRYASPALVHYLERNEKEARLRETKEHKEMAESWGRKA